MNRRSEPRFDVYYRAKIIAVDNPDTQIDALLTDISGGGMRLVAMQELPEDQMICVEVGQHLVLAEVRRAVPRGSRFLIGAEKIHTLSLLTLPESMSSSDRIQALVDDYHLRIQFGLDSDRRNKSDISALSDAPAKRSDPADTDSLAAKLQNTAASIPIPEELAVTTAADTPKEEIARSPLPTTAVGVPVQTTAATSAAPPQDPELAPPMRSDPAPASLRPLPLSTAAEVDFGKIRIVLPEVRGTGEEIVPEALSETDPENRLSTIPPTADTAYSDTPPSDITASGTRPSNTTPSDTTPADTPPKDGLSLDLPLPVQPIWMAPQGGAAPVNGETHGDGDPLRALALQRSLAEVAEPEPRNYSRTIIALTAGLVAGVALVSLLFGPIRNRAALLSPFASASERGSRKAPSETPKDLVIPVDPAADKPADVASDPSSAVTPTAAATSGSAATAASAPASAPVAAVPGPAKAPSRASAGSRVQHSSTVRTSAPSWFSGCADGKLLAGRMLPGGSDLEIEFSRQAQVLVGNAGVVDMSLDGKPLGPLGPVGRARAVELTPEGFHVVTSLASQECVTP